MAVAEIVRSMLFQKCPREHGGNHSLVVSGGCENEGAADYLTTRHPWPALSQKDMSVAKSWSFRLLPFLGRPPQGGNACVPLII